MATRKRKSRKKRGTRTVGYGRIGQHRKHGDIGGHGNAGLHKYKWSWTVKYVPKHFGRYGFKPPVPSTSKADTWINVSDLDAISERTELKEKDGLRVIDLNKLGVKKLLGSGNIKGSYYVIVGRATERAIDKVEKAGGKVELVK